MWTNTRLLLSRRIWQRKILRRFSTEANSTATSSTPVGTPVVKEPLTQRWKRFWKFLYSDYREVAIDTVKDMKEKPKKAAYYFMGIGAVLYALETNPEGRTYYHELVESADQMILVSDLNRNTAVEERLRRLHASYNEGTVRCLNLGLFSLIWLANYHFDCAIYPAQCSYLKPGIINFHKRVVDVGFFGRWWNMDWYMRDFDINPDEFAAK